MKVISPCGLLFVTVLILVDKCASMCDDLGLPCVNGILKRDPANCNSFCHCAHEKWFSADCPKGLAFDEEHMVCNWPQNVAECDDPAGLCTPNPCLNGGTCSRTNGGYTCACRSGYGGTNCMDAQNACQFNPCQNGGTCEVTFSNDAVCSCPPSYTGRFCQDVNDPCPRYPCASDISSYNYPDWDDNSCRNYFNCRQGVLSSRTCPFGQEFSFIELTCINAASLEFRCSDNFI